MLKWEEEKGMEFKKSRKSLENIFIFQSTFLIYEQTKPFRNLFSIFSYLLPFFFTLWRLFRDAKNNWTKLNWHFGFVLFSFRNWLQGL